MNGINKVQVEAISIKDPMDGDWGKWWPYGIKIQGEWWNGSLKTQEHVDAMNAKIGQEVEMFFYQDNSKPEKYRNKVRFVTDKDRKEAPKRELVDASDDNYQSPEQAMLEAFKRIEVLEAKVFKLENPIEGGTELDHKEPMDTTDDEGQPDDLEDNSQLPF